MTDKERDELALTVEEWQRRGELDPRWEEYHQQVLADMEEVIEECEAEEREAELSWLEKEDRDDAAYLKARRAQAMVEKALRGELEVRIAELARSKRDIPPRRRRSFAAELRSLSERATHWADELEVR